MALARCGHCVLCALQRAAAGRRQHWPSAMPTVAQCHAHSGPAPCPQWPSAMPTVAQCHAHSGTAASSRWPSPTASARCRSVCPSIVQPQPLPCRISPRIGAHPCHVLDRSHVLSAAASLQLMAVTPIRCGSPRRRSFTGAAMPSAMPTSRSSVWPRDCRSAPRRSWRRCWQAGAALTLASLSALFERFVRFKGFIIAFYNRSCLSGSFVSKGL